MNYLSQLNEKEVHYICTVIPHKHSIYYFQSNPKEFARIMPGFRAKSMKNHEQVIALLFRYHNHDFISSFIEKHISNWLSEIQEHITKMMENGDSKELALLHTLPFCFFANNLDLFFKLMNEKYTKEYFSLLGAAVLVIKEVSVQQDKLERELKVKESEIKSSQSELDLAKSDLKKIGIKLNRQNTEIKDLKRSFVDLVKLKSTIRNDNKIMLKQETKIQEQGETIKNLENELFEAKNRNQQLEIEIRFELEKQHATNTNEQQVATKPKCPRDMEEFKEYLGYNLENIGVPAKSEYYPLLKEHLSKILFQGIPIVVNHSVGTSLIKIIANTLIGQPKVEKIAFRENLLLDDIESFLLSAGRIVCLYDFIGNFNETELLTLFDNHKNKVIFLTVPYERTIHYVSGEFFRYCQYLNLNRIPAFTLNIELGEDPSTIEEVEFESQGISYDNRHASLLRKMLGEFGFLASLVEQKCTAISDEQDLHRTLAFDVLPYCVDVLKMAPYNTSAQLIKYVEDARRCPYKNLFKAWFAG